MSFLLKVISNREAGIEYPLQQGDNLVGRSRSADIRVQNEDVSGKHFIIKVTGNSAELVNLSHYGTGLDGFTIQDKSEILPGQTIEAGKSLQFVFTQLVESEPEEQEVSDETGVTRFAADIDRQPSEEIYENDTPEAGEETGVTRFAADIDRQASEEDMPEVGEETGVTRLAADISPHNAVAEAETDEEDMTSATRLASAVNINENETVLPHDASVRKESQGGGEITGIGTIAAGVSLQGVIEAKNSSAPAVNLNDTFVDEDESFGDATETGTRIEATVSDHTSATDGRTKNTAAHGNDLTPIDDATFFQDDDSDEGEKTNANETQVVQTRMANLDEISFIKNQIKKQQQSRLFFKFLIFILLVVFFGIIWILKAPQQEKTLSWPQVKEANGALTYATGRLSAFEIGTSQNGFDVYYPKWPNTRIEVKDPSCTVIHTSLGRAADVPLTIILQREESDEFIYENRGVAMKNMLRRLSEKKDELFNFDGTPNMLFLVPESGPAGNGVLCNMIAYQRDAGESQFGILRFFRDGKYNYILRAEVPAEEKLRALSILTNDTFLVLSQNFVRLHWEGNEEYTKGDTERLMLGVKDELLNRNSPMQYPRLELTLKSILAQSLYDRQEKYYSEALELFKHLRDKQQQWYNGQRIRWFSADAGKNNSEKIKIRNESEAVFSIAGDKRRNDILRDHWE